MRFDSRLYGNRCHSGTGFRYPSLIQTLVYCIVWALQTTSLCPSWPCWGTWGTWSPRASAKRITSRSSAGWPIRWEEVQPTDQSDALCVCVHVCVQWLKRVRVRQPMLLLIFNTPPSSIANLFQIILAFTLDNVSLIFPRYHTMFFLYLEKNILNINISDLLVWNIVQCPSL